MDKNEALAVAGNTYNAGHFEKAKKLFECIATAYPEDITAKSYLGLIAVQKADYETSLRYFAEVVGLDPGSPLHHANLAGALLHLKNAKSALEAANNALKLDKDYPSALLIAGSALLSLGKYEESIVFLKRLVFIYPEHIEGLHLLAKAHLWLKEYEAVEQLLQKAIALSPQNIEILITLATFLYKAHRNKEALSVCETIIKNYPDHLAASYIHCFALLPYIYNNESEVNSVRLQYEKELLALRDLCRNADTITLANTMFCLGLCQPFALPYQGENDRNLQKVYGDIVASFINPQTSPSPKKGKRVRVGFVSGFFKHHSNWKTHLSGWIKKLNQKNFALFGYYTGNEKNAITDEASCFLERMCIGLKSVKEYSDALKEDQLDAIIFPEIGMDSMTMTLAAMRHAPIQCASWGHPCTSGLHSIDYFLSSDMMEPINGAEYYTERLVRLPNLSIYYEPATAIQAKKNTYRLWISGRGYFVLVLSNAV